MVDKKYRINSFYNPMGRHTLYFAEEWRGWKYFGAWYEIPYSRCQEIQQVRIILDDYINRKEGVVEYR